MGLRFRKSIQLLPGVRINFGLHSTSVSVGGKGFRSTYSTTGRVTRSIGIPGTGLSYVTSRTMKNRDVSRIETLSDRHNLPSQRNGLPNNAAKITATTPGQSFADADIDSIRESIQGIFRLSDNPINWRQILVSEENPGMLHWDYLKSRAESVLNGDIDTYFEIISDINPFDDLIQYGSNFECGTDDPRMLIVEFHVNSKAVFDEGFHVPEQMRQDLLQDYICGCTLRVARDVFALLPLRDVIVNAIEEDHYVVSVDYEKQRFEKLNFLSLDASNTVEGFIHRMNYTKESGFSPIDPLY